MSEPSEWLIVGVHVAGLFIGYHIGALAMLKKYAAELDKLRKQYDDIRRNGG